MHEYILPNRDKRLSSSLVSKEMDAAQPASELLTATDS
jgi:hypothetical protein